MKTLATLALVTIALCQLGNTVALYESDEGGYNIYFGNLYGYHYGYHFGE